MFVPPLDPFATLNGLDEERHDHASYRWENEGRGTGEEAVIQQTLGGAAFFENATGRYFVPAGFAMLFSYREASFYGYPPKATEPYRLRYISFQLASLRPCFDRVRAEFGSVVRMHPEGEASTLLLELFRRFRTSTFRDRLQQAEILHQLIVAIYREQIAASETRDPVEFGYHQLRENFSSPLNLKMVAKRCGVSREHFIRSFGKRYGEPPGEFLRRLRMEQAHRMLRATQLPVQEIALACGFTDANSFCRAYRMKYGTSPGKARSR